MTAYGASDATSHYHPIVSSFIKSQIDSTFLVLPAYTGCPGTAAIKQVSVSLSGRVTGRAERQKSGGFMEHILHRGINTSREGALLGVSD